MGRRSRRSGDDGPGLEEVPEREVYGSYSHSSHLTYNPRMPDSFDRIPRTLQALESGIRDRLHLGAQLHVSQHGEAVASGAVGEDRPGVPLTSDHLMLWLSST